MIRAAKAAVDHEQAPVRANGLLALGGVHGRVSVHDMPRTRGHAELRHDGIAHRLVLGQLEIGVHGLDPAIRVVNVGALEGLDQTAARRGLHADPEVPHPVERVLVALAPGTTRDLIAEVEVIAAATPGTQAVHARERAILVQRDATVEQQVVIAHQIHGTVAVEELDMATQVVGARELRHELLDDPRLLGRELIGMLRVERREIARGKLVHRAIVQLDSPRLDVDALEQQSVVHVEAPVAHDDLPLELEQQDVHGLRQRRELGSQAGYAIGNRLVGALGKRYELTQGDTVVVLQDLEIAVAQVVAQNRDDARRLTGGRAHPQQVVIAPLDIQRVVLHQAVHDLGGPAAAVEDIAHQMQMVDDQPLDEIGQRADKVLACIGLQDRRDNALVIAHAVVVLIGVRVQQLVDDVGVIAWDGLADLGARVTAGQGTRHHQQALEHDLVPARRRDVLQMRERELLMRVVDEGAQVALFLLGELVAEDIVHVLAHHARAVVEDMQERLVFTVQVAHEMLGALGQVEDCLQVDDLGEHRLLRGKMLREQAQVLERLVGAGDHDAAPPFCWTADTCFQVTTPHQPAPRRQSGTGAKLRMDAKKPPR